ncbi:MAG TPA: DNA polymerase III subunit chi [Methylotenera sp.]|jgi:DNA polymerase-3 subunit chi|nr:DNA polymerase III subunit chi [Methylotenera sp.]
MTRIDFYFNVANKQQLLAELVQGALSKRRHVTVLANDANNAAEINADLWQQLAGSFMPNVLVNHDLAALTPVVIHWGENALLQDDMLINLTPTEPIFFSRFTHLVELVGDDEQDKVAARARYKFYRDRGYEIKNTNHAQT